MGHCKQKRGTANKNEAIETKFIITNWSIGPMLISPNITKVVNVVFQEIIGTYDSKEHSKL